MPATASPPLLDTSLCTFDLKSRSRDSALAEIVERLGAVVRDAATVRESLARRERLATTATGKGVALPNVRSVAVAAGRVVLARSSRGLAWEAADREPVRLVCAVLSPSEWSEETHHEWLALAAGSLRLQRTRQRLLDAPDAAARLALWREAIG